MGELVAKPCRAKFWSKGKFHIKRLENYDAGARATSTMTSDYDVKYYRLNLSANPAVRYIRGSVTTHFTPKINNFNTIHFNLRNNMSVDSVKYHGVHVLYHNFISSTVLQINLPASIQMAVLDSLTIYYQGFQLMMDSAHLAWAQQVVAAYTIRWCGHFQNHMGPKTGGLAKRLLMTKRTQLTWL